MNTFMFEKQSYPKPITEQDIRKIIKDDGLEVIEETLTGLLLYCAQLGKELSVNFIEKISASNIADRIHISSAIPENYHIDKNVLAQYLWNVCDRNAFVTLNEIVILWNDGENLDPEQARLYEEYYDEFVRELAVNQLGQMWFDRNIVAINMYEIVKTAREIAEENKNFSSPYFKFENILREGILTTALHELRHLHMDQIRQGRSH